MNGDRICFIDTNVWLYALIEGQDKTKARVARLLIQQSKPIVSPQIVNEVCANLVKRSQRTEEEIRLLIEAFYDKYPVIEPNKAVLIKASELREQYRLSYWDSLLVSSALHSNAPLLYSEDMQHGLVVENRLRIVSPFIVEN